MSAKIVFLDRATLAEGIRFKPLVFDHEYQEFAKTEPAQRVIRCKEATAILTNKVVLDRATLDQLPNLRYVGIAATGVNVVDLQACKERGVVVTNVEKYGTDSVAEHVFSVMLAMIKQLIPYQRAVQAGEWQRRDQFCFFLDPIHSLKGKQLGLIGTGSIAQRVADLARAFDMKVEFYSPSGRLQVQGQDCIALATLLAMSDVVSVHCPLSSNTFKLVGEAEFQLMRPSALLINTARGAVVDTEALLVALRHKRIGGAALDVLPVEPPPLDDPIFAASSSLHNLLLTPHIAWAATEAMQCLADQMMDKLNRFFLYNQAENLAH